MKTPVRNHMTSRNVVVAHKDHKFSQILQFFAQSPVHHIPVTEGENEKVIGMISAKDVIRHFYNHLVKHDFNAKMDELDEEHPIEDLMTANPITIGPDEPLESAARIFEQNRFHSIPVVCEENTVCGIITTKDIAKQILLKR